MRVILINLARAQDRREKMARQFTALGIDYEILEATDGRNLTPADRAWVDDEARRRITPYPLTDNEIGCWISHRRAMLSLIEGGQEMAAIIEDDADLTPDFSAALAAIEAMQEPFDGIDLHRNFKRGELFTPVRPLGTDNRLGRVGYTHMNLTAYVMSRRGAQRFIVAASRFVHAVDKELHRYWDNGLDLYGLERPVAAQNDGGFSYIDETRHQDRPTLRARYPDADSPLWRFHRWRAKCNDSIRKRLAWRRLARAVQKA